MATSPQNQTSKAKVSRLGGARINDDWQYLNEGKTIQNPTTDQKFNLEYKQKGLNSVNISKPKLIKKQTNQKTGETKYAFKSRIITTKKIEQNEQEDNEEVKNNLTSPTLIKKVTDKKRSLVATAINFQLSAAFLPFYLIQLNLALISLIGMGALGGGNALVDYAEKEGGWLGGVVAGAIKSVVDDLNDIFGHFTGYSLTGAASSLFMIPFFIILVINIVFILIVVLRHKLALNNPVFGEQGGYAKFVALIFYVFGLFPVFNIFPFFLIWLYTIQKYPR